MGQKQLDDAVAEAQSRLTAATKKYAESEERSKGFEAAAKKNEDLTAEIVTDAAGKLFGGRSLSAAITATMDKLRKSRGTVEPRFLESTSGKARELLGEADLAVIRCREALQRAQDKQREGKVLSAAAELNELLPAMEAKATALRELLSGYQGVVAMPACDLTNLGWVCEESAHRRSKFASRQDTKLIADLDREVLVAHAKEAAHG